MKISDKSERIKYIRALDRFVKSAIAMLKRDDFDGAIFCAKISKNLEVLRRVEAVYLDSPYTRALESFANEIINQTAKFDEQNYIDTTTLIRQANGLEKLKNAKSYKKDKHKNLDDEF